MESIVYRNKWMSVVNKLNTSGDSFYYFSEADKVVILPYFYHLGSVKIVCLIEPVSTWGRDKELTAITGSVEEYETPEQSAVRELEEEAGIIVPFDSDKWIELGEFNVSKSLSSKRHHYLVNIGNAEFSDHIETDGSFFEKKTKKYVVSTNVVKHSSDLSFNFLAIKLREHLNIY